MSLNLDELVLRRGDHPRREDGVCLMEAVAWFAGERHSYVPTCTSEFLALVGARLNDNLFHENRQKLIPFIPRLAGANNREADARVGLIMLDWVVRKYAAKRAGVAGFLKEAKTLSGLPEISLDNAEEMALAVSSVLNGLPEESIKPPEHHWFYYNVSFPPFLGSDAARAFAKLSPDEQKPLFEINRNIARIVELCDWRFIGDSEHKFNLVKELQQKQLVEFIGVFDRVLTECYGR